MGTQMDAKIRLKNGSMMSRIIRTITEIEVNKELAAEFREHLENELAGIYDPRDKRELEKMIAEVDQKEPADWSSDVKKELVLFVCCAAAGAFQCGVGWTPVCYMKPRQRKAGE